MISIKTDYRNVFREVGYSDEEIRKRLEEVKQEFFYSDDRVYFEAPDQMGYLCDTGNNDVRTEGMSYGMMFCVQLNMKEEFDRIWKWAKTYMFMTDGFNEGYFAWSCATDGTKNANGPAPDGEEFFAMALFFAAHRWGNGEGIFHYEKEAKDLLHTCIHKGRDGRVGEPMWNLENHQILFVPGIDYTDPSYHLPHFYELFGEWAYEEDREFFKEAAKASRLYLASACHEKTGFSPEYGEFDGTPMRRPIPWTTVRFDRFYSDSYRTVANIGLDYEWFGIDVGQKKAADAIQKFLVDAMRKNEFHAYEVDGTELQELALHPVGLLATVAQASLAADNEYTVEWVKRFFEMPMRKGVRRYYDNCLYMFAFLALSGNYRML